MFALAETLPLQRLPRTGLYISQTQAPAGAHSSGLFSIRCDNLWQHALVAIDIPGYPFDTSLHR
jgi:hypothetical protein